MRGHKGRRGPDRRRPPRPPPARADDQGGAVAAVAALDEPTRRRLYDHVVRQSGPVSRDDAAEAVGLPRSTAAFHLDRLADEGLLEVVYERLTGRSGPGAGRPSKLYRRSDREVAVSLPGRRYDLAGELLAQAVDEAEESGEAPRTVLARRAEAAGRDIGARARAADPGGSTRAVVLGALEEQGYEPRETGGEAGDGTGAPSDEGGAQDRDVVLANCPFHGLVDRHTALVCGMNLHLLGGLVDEVDGAALHPRLEPAPGRCCVVLGPG